MLSIFEPGISVPWLGDIQKLGPAYELPDNPYQINSKDNSEETPFPVPAPRQRSYRSSSTAVWIKSSGLQVCDISINDKISEQVHCGKFS